MSLLPNPAHQAALRAHLDVARNLELGLIARYMDDLPSSNADRYLTLDFRLGWRPEGRLGVALAGRNLLHNHRREFDPEFLDTLPTEIQRSMYGAFAWRS